MEQGRRPGQATSTASGRRSYALLTGRALFQGTVASVLDAVQEGTFPAPRAARPDVPRALEAVCLKAMARRPDDRYASAGDLADDVENWMADRPVTAWREPWSVRSRRWMARHRTRVAGVLAFLTTAVVALAMSNFLLNAEKNRTEVAHREAVANEKKARDQATIANGRTRPRRVATAGARREELPGRSTRRSISSGSPGSPTTPS